MEGREVGFVDNIRAWLSKLGLPQYAEAFEHNDVALDLLQTLTDQDLRELGVDSMGHRKMLLRAIAELKGAETPTLVPPVEALRATPVAPTPRRIRSHRRRTPPADGDVLRPGGLDGIVRTP